MKNIMKSVFFVFFMAGGTVASDTVVENKPENDSIIVYYFHSTSRCVSCIKIEKWSYDAITDSFPDAMKEGKLVWRPNNIDKQENKRFIKEYTLFTNTLIVTEIKKGKQVRWKNPDKV